MTFDGDMLPSSKCVNKFELILNDLQAKEIKLRGRKKKTKKYLHTIYKLCEKVWKYVKNKYCLVVVVEIVWIENVAERQSSCTNIPKFGLIRLHRFGSDRNQIRKQ